MPRLAKILDALERHYGKPARPITRDPWKLILLENVLYLANDERRVAAFRALKRTIGFKPQEIMKASDQDLLAITRMGSIVPFQSAKKLRYISEVAHYIFKDNLKAVMKLPLAEAKKALRKFPGLGEPGSEKILMFAGAHPVLALDSNGLRVLRRIGWGEDKKSYSATYRSAKDAVQPELKDSAEWLIRAYQLLRQHGQETCRRNGPLCSECPVRMDCALFALGPQKAMAARSAW
jgi:endonuclease III